MDLNFARELNRRLYDYVAREDIFWSAADTIRALPAAPRLVVLESTVPPGTTRRFAHLLGREAFVAHAPERLSAGHDWKTFVATPHLVGGVDEASSELAAAFFARLVERVVPVSSAEVSELSKLMENAFLSVGIALAGEITRVARGLGISAAEVCAAAATKPFGYLAFHPGPGIGGHCLPNDLEMLRAAFRDLGLAPSLLDSVAAVASGLPGLVVDRLDDLLGGRLSDAEVLLVGVGFKVGSADTTATPAASVARELRARGARVSYLDSRVEGWAVDGRPVPRRIEPGLPTAVVVLAGDPAVSPEALRSASPVVLDAGGGGAMARPLRGASRL